MYYSSNNIPSRHGSHCVASRHSEMSTPAIPPDAEVATGSVCAIKKLYQHSDNGFSLKGPWSEIKDPFLEAQRIRQLGQTHAIIHRFNNPNENGYWETHSIQVNSPLLQAVLTKVFEGYPGWSSSSQLPKNPSFTVEKRLRKHTKPRKTREPRWKSAFPARSRTTYLKKPCEPERGDNHRHNHFREILATTPSKITVHIRVRRQSQRGQTCGCDVYE